MKRSLLTLVALGVTTLGAQAQVTRSGAGYLMRVKYTKGQVIRLNTSNSVAGLNSTPGGKMQFKTPITLRVLEVQGTKAKVQMKMGAVTYGSTIMNPGSTAVVTLDNRNRPVDGGANAGVGAALPAQTIKVGSTWQGTVPISTQLGNSRITAKYKFAGLKNLGGRMVAVITYVVSGMATGTGRMTLLAKDGTLNSNEMKLTMSAGQAPLTIVSTMTRA
jgi:hypothetical protein